MGGIFEKVVPSFRSAIFSERSLPSRIGSGDRVHLGDVAAIHGVQLRATVDLQLDPYRSARVAGFLARRIDAGCVAG